MKLSTNANILEDMNHIISKESKNIHKTSPQSVVGARKEARTVRLKAIKIHLNEKRKTVANCRLDLVHFPYL